MGKFGRRQTQAAWVGGALAEREEQAVEFKKTVSNVGGWVSIVPLSHMCFPPEVYPRDAGPGSGWGCKHCGSFWMSNGCQVVGDYPDNSQTAQAVGPVRWIYVTGPKSDRQIEIENDLYDWRSVPFYNARLLRRLIELNGGAWEDA